jgi:hypothetical protein
MSQQRTPKPQAQQKHPDEWQRDLNPHHLAGQNIGEASESRVEYASTAFHVRKQGYELRGLDDEELKQVPVVAEGTKLQQGATYVDLTDLAPEEFTATGEMVASSGQAIAPKDRVPYEIWNRLIGRPKPGQE